LGHPPRGTPSAWLALNQSLDISGWEWSLVFVPAPGRYSQWPPPAAWAALAGGLFLTFLVVAYFSGMRRMMRALRREARERERARAALRRNRDFLSAILDTTGALVVLLDVQGRIVGFNHACEALTGYSLREVEGRTWDVLLPPDEIERVRAIIESLHGGAAASKHEHDLLAKDGRRLRVTWSTTVLQDAAGGIEHVICTGIDVTERRRAEQAETAHLLRLGTVSEMTAGLAHEVSQPLGIIANYAQSGLRRLHDGAQRPDEVAAQLQEIAAQAQRAAQIIEHLRRLVRKEAPVAAEVDVNAAVQAVLALLRGDVSRRGVTIRAELGEAMPSVSANRVQIEQVILNVVRNAIEAMAAHSAQERVLHIATEHLAERDRVQVTVCDTGPGIPEAVRSRLFEPFQTTKTNGMGMGLSISRSIIQSHGGRLWVEPAPSGGACFRFTLPLAARVAPSEAAVG
jgi:PAS domain S-box-containing protein